RLRERRRLQRVAIASALHRVQLQGDRRAWPQRVYRGFSLSFLGLSKSAADHVSNRLGDIVFILVMDIRAVDLNLLKAFDALMSERAVTRVAGRIGLSQPAMSHALSRLRSLFADDLFVRTPNRMEPTARARDRAARLRRDRAYRGGAQPRRRLRCGKKY